MSEILLLDPDTTVNQTVLLPVGFYVLVLFSYFSMALINDLQGWENGLMKSSQLTALLYFCMGGTLLVSGWIGYSEYGLLVAGAVGSIPALAFTTVGVTLTALDLNDPDTYIWVFALPLLGVGLLIAALGFLTGTGIRLVVT